MLSQNSFKINWGNKQRREISLFRDFDRRFCSGLTKHQITEQLKTTENVGGTYMWWWEDGTGTSMVWEAVRFLSQAMSASLAKSVSWSARRADFLDSRRRTSSMRFWSSNDFWNKNELQFKKRCDKRWIYIKIGIKTAFTVVPLPNPFTRGCSEWTLKPYRYIIKNITPGNIRILEF